MTDRSRRAARLARRRRQERPRGRRPEPDPRPSRVGGRVAEPGPGASGPASDAELQKK
jgi:hypothetical protein